MEDSSEQKKNIEISILKGDKLFNENTPFIINLFAPESKEQEEKRVNADLICVIDISGSMQGEKIELVKESLKILVEMMEPKDRIALVLFDQQSKLLYDLNFLDEKNKKQVINLINQIEARGGTNIASGLQVAVDILKKEKKNEKEDEGRSSSIILLSDGCDNYSDDVVLAEKLKSLTKGEGLSFTLNTFGYGYDHDPKIMNKLANLRDGSFFLVEDYNKVGEYFVSVLGGCISMISKNAEVEVKLLNEKCKIKKIFGANNFYSHELTDLLFKNKMLQFITGKEYTFVLEIFVDESAVKPEDILLEVNFIYDEILSKNQNKLNVKYKYELKDLKFAKANDEYVRSQTYDVLDRVLKLNEDNKSEEAKKLLNEMKVWIEKNYKDEYKSYLEDIKKSEQIFEFGFNARRGVTTTISMVSQNMSKRMGSNSNMYSNSVQMRLQDNYRNSYTQKIMSNKNNNFV
jgi:uncharacterized protein YegL